MDADQTHTTEIDANLATCVDVLLDFERYPIWSGPIQSARVLSVDAEGRGVDVAFELDMKLRTVRYTLRYSYELPSRATWALIEGDVRAVEGAYEFEDIGGGRTRATCRQAVDLGFWVPGPLKRMAERQALRDSVAEFKAEAETRERSASV